MIKAWGLADSAAPHYNKIIVEAQAKFIKAKKLDLSLGFWTWVIKNAPEVSNTETAHNATQVELPVAVDIYFGPLAAELLNYIHNIKNALSQDLSSEWVFYWRICLRPYLMLNQS